MKCTVCNLKLDSYERSLPNDPEWYPDDETWMVDYDEDNKEYYIITAYDCGCASMRIRNIKYCPNCGRRLEVNNETTN